MYRCEPCNINYTSTRKLFSHQLSPEHIKRQRSINTNHAHSIPQQFSNRRIERAGVGIAGGGSEVGGEIGITAASVNPSATATYNNNTYGTETAGPSTSMNVNRGTKPQQRLNKATDATRRSNIISQSNLSPLADGAKGAMRKKPGTSGARGGKFNGRRASVVPGNRQRTTGTHLINQPAAPAGPQLGNLQYRRVSTASRKPAQKVFRTVRQRNERAKSIQRKVAPVGSGAIPQGNKPVPRTQQRGTSAVINTKAKTKSFNKQQQKQSVNLPKISLRQGNKVVSTSVPSIPKLSVISPRKHINLEEKKVGMNVKHNTQTEKAEPQQQEKSCGVREHMLLPPKKSLQTVVSARPERGGQGGKAPPKKNVQRYNRFISVTLSPIWVEGDSPYQLSGELVVPSTSSTMRTNTQTVTAVATVSGNGHGGDVVLNAAASPCKASESSLEATPPKKNLKHGLHPIQHSGKSSKGAESSPYQPIHMAGVPTASSLNRSGKKLTAGAATPAARHGGRVASKSSAVPLKAKGVPGKALAPKKNSFKAIQPSGVKGKGAQSSQKGKYTKPPTGVVVPTTSSGTANPPGKKKTAVTIVSAPLGRVATKAATSKTRGVGGKAPHQKKNRNLANPIQAASKKNTGVPKSPNLQSTKRPPGGVVPWLSAVDRGSEVVARKPTVTATTAKRIAQPKLAKVRKGVKKVTLKQLKDYVPTMPGTDYKMPLLTAIGSYTSNEGKKLWICLVCSKTEPMKSSKPMVCCEICNDWYHFKCVGIKKKMPTKDPWYCKRCICRSSEKKNLKNV